MLFRSFILLRPSGYIVILCTRVRFDCCWRHKKNNTKETCLQLGILSRFFSVTDLFLFDEDYASRSGSNSWRNLREVSGILLQICQISLSNMSAEQKIEVHAKYLSQVLVLSKRFRLQLCCSVAKKMLFLSFPYDKTKK